MDEAARKYKVLQRTRWQYREYALVPIRDADKYAILRMRNEQIKVLRQRGQLTREQQENYFRTIVDPLFAMDQPEQLLFSFLLDSALIGYGGLVHIDWAEKSGEVSFLTLTQRDQNEMFTSDFTAYLHLLKSIAFDELKFTKLHTTFYDIPQRDAYRQVIEQFGFRKEKTLAAHVDIDGRMRDAHVFSLLNQRT